jgi:hypothetical protein
VTLETGVTRRMKRESDSVVLASFLEKSKILERVSLRSSFGMALMYLFCQKKSVGYKVKKSKVDQK